MASKNINVLMSLQDYFSDPMRKIGKTTEATEKKLKAAQNGLANFGNRANNTFLTAVKGVAAFGTALAGLAIGGAIAGFKSLADEGMAAAQKQIQAETQLEAILKNVASIQERGAGATQKAADSLKAYAGELQQVGIIGDEVTLAGMAQLATFQMNDDQIKTVSASMLDLLAKTKGYNATQEDAVNIANMIGKAMTGNAGALSRVGITMTEAEKDAIKFGDANQRAAIIAKVLQSNVGGVNAAMAKTAQGRQQQAMNAYGDMLEEFGKKLLPIRADLWGAFGEVLPEIQNAMMPVFDMLAQWFKDILPDVKEFIKELAKALPGAVQTVISVFNTLGPVLKGVWNTLKMLSPVIAGVVAGFTAFNIIKTVIAGFQMLQTVIMLARNATLLFNIAMSLNPLSMIVIAIGFVVAALVALYKNWDKIVAYFGPTVQAISDWFRNAWESIKTVAENVWNGIIDSFTSCINRLKDLWESFKSAISSPIDTVIRARKEQIAAGQNATGTSYFPGGWTHVNEGGRGELINLPSGSQIIPNSLSKAALAGGGNQNINITVNVAGNVIGNDDFYNECGRVITERLTLALGNM